MGSRAKKKLRIIPAYKGEDRISGLPDELVHKIYSFLDAKEAVQASVLSKRWKLMWTTLPFLGFGRYGSISFKDFSRFSMFIRHVLSNRNHQSHLSELEMYIAAKLTVKQSVSKKKFRGCVIEKFIQYAILHNVKCLNISINYKHKPYKLSTFSSNLLEELTLRVQLEEPASESDCWDLPALTTLHLKYTHEYGVDYKLHESWLTSLPALRTLSLDVWDLSETSFSLPNLTTLRLFIGRLPRRVWDLPALLSLQLDYVRKSKNMSDLFSSLVNVKNLTLIVDMYFMQQDHFISCPQLLNLNIKTYCHDPPYGNIVVSAPQLCNFSCVGIFSITFGVPELENVNIKLNDWFRSYVRVDKKIYYQRFTHMLTGLGTAKNLSFDLESIEALSEISDYLANFSSPFFNLKYLKLPKEYKESTISSALRSYLLGGSRRATIVKSLPQKNRLLLTPVSVVAENAAVYDPLAEKAKELGDCQYINETVCVDTVETGVRKQDVMENSQVDVDRAGQTNAPVGGTDKDPVSSSKGNRDFGLWQGHEVNSEFVCLLDRIMHKYPETFEHFTPKNKKLCTMHLNMLCTSLNDFTKISMTEVSSEIIVEYRDVFAYLKSKGFNVSWLVDRLNYVENLKFSKPLIPKLHEIDCRIDDANSKLQDLRALRMEILTEIQSDFGTMGTNLAAGFIGDDLLSGP